MFEDLSFPDACLFSALSSRSTFTTHSTHHQIDPDFVNSLADSVEIARVQFLECDTTECAMATGDRAADGWHFHGGLDEGRQTTKKVLMTLTDDTE